MEQKQRTARVPISAVDTIVPYAGARSGNSPSFHPERTRRAGKLASAANLKFFGRAVL
jgi:hypothetical protein